VTLTPPFSGSGRPRPFAPAEWDRGRCPMQGHVRPGWTLCTSTSPPPVSPMVPDTTAKFSFLALARRSASRRLVRGIHREWHNYRGLRRAARPSRVTSDVPDPDILPRPQFAWLNKPTKGGKQLGVTPNRNEYRLGMKVVVWFHADSRFCHGLYSAPYGGRCGVR